MAEEAKGDVASETVAAPESMNIEDLMKDPAFMDLFSRQIATFGMQSMAKLVTMHVVIVGLKGLGVEVAKNVILAGPFAVTLVDKEPAAPKHQGANFYVKDSDLGTPLAAACRGELQSLNDRCKVFVADELSEKLVESARCIVFTEGTRAELVKWNKIARKHNCAFVSTNAWGFSGSVFTDFGDKHTMFDSDGLAPSQCRITHISNDEKGLVRVLSAAEGGTTVGKPHKIECNDHTGWVRFAEVEGMHAKDEAAYRKYGLNINETSEPFRCEYVDPHTIKVGDLSGLSEYRGGGLLIQVKRPVDKSYSPLSACLLNKPEQELTDFTKFYRDLHLHIAYQGVYSYMEAHEGAFPPANDDAAAAEVLKLAKAINESAKVMNASCGATVATCVDDLDEEVVLRVARHAAVELQPVACFFGAVAAQEVVKATGLYTPIDQFLYLDFFEALPEERPTDTAPQNSRYDNQIAVFGKAFQEKILNSSTFMVGCGALGCELMKNFAMIGIGCGEGRVYTTDDDVVEVSNLSRQFLFRMSNVKQEKSVAAANAIKAMNPSFNVTPYKLKAMPSTEGLFNDAFYESLSFVTNALDSVTARMYVDARCVYYNKHLLESSTTGVAANVASYWPHKTASYADGTDVYEGDGPPMCTLHLYPVMIEHCIEWSRDRFAALFEIGPANVRDCIANKKKFVMSHMGKRGSEIKSSYNTLKQVQWFLDQLDGGMTFEKCIKLAVSYWYTEFRDKIKDIVNVHPRDEVSDGVAFWGPGKRFPNGPEELDTNDATTMTFIISAANIFAVIFGVVNDPEDEEAGGPVPADDQKRDPEYFKRIIETIPVPEYVPSRLDEGDDKDEDGDGEDESKLSTMQEERKAYKELISHFKKRKMPKGLVVKPCDFEKDHDYNFHMDFIHSFTNGRASIYGIENTNMQDCKVKAGSIIAAIATTTAGATALVMIEMYKILQDKDISTSRKTDFGLASNFYQFLGADDLWPTKAGKDASGTPYVTFPEEGFTKWDHLVFEGNLTLREFREQFEKRTGATVDMLYHPVANNSKSSCSGMFLFPPESPDYEAQFFDKPLVDYINKVYAAEELIFEGRTKIPLEVSASNAEGVTVKTPSVILNFSA